MKLAFLLQSVRSNNSVYVRAVLMSFIILSTISALFAQELPWTIKYMGKFDGYGGGRPQRTYRYKGYQYQIVDEGKPMIRTMLKINEQTAKIEGKYQCNFQDLTVYDGRYYYNKKVEKNDGKTGTIDIHLIEVDLETMKETLLYSTIAIPELRPVTNKEFRLENYQFNHFSKHFIIETSHYYKPLMVTYIVDPVTKKVVKEEDAYIYSKMIDGEAYYEVYDRYEKEARGYIAAATLKKLKFKEKPDIKSLPEKGDNFGVDVGKSEEKVPWIRLWIDHKRAFPDTRLLRPVEFIGLNEKDKIVQYWNTNDDYFPERLRPQDKATNFFNDYYNLKKEIRNTTELALASELEKQATRAFNSFCTTLDPCYVDESNTLVFYDAGEGLKRMLSAINLTHPITYKVHSGNAESFKVKVEEHAKNTLLHFAQSLKKEEVNQRMEVKNTPFNYADKPIGAHITNQGNSVYAFWENTFYRIDNAHDTVVAFKPLIEKPKQVAPISEDIFVVSSDVKYQIIDMKQGVVVSEVKFPSQPLYGLGEVRFHPNLDGKTGKFYATQNSSYFYIDTQTLAMLELYQKSTMDRLAEFFTPFNSEKGDRLFNPKRSEHAKEDGLFKDTYFCLWDVKNDGNIRKGEGSTIKIFMPVSHSLKAESKQVIFNPATNKLEKLYGFLNGDNTCFEVFSGSVEPDNPGLWKADLVKLKISPNLPDFGAKSRDVTRLFFSDGPSTNKQSVSSSGSSNVCPVCDGNPVDKTKRCTNACNFGKLKIKAGSTTRYNSGGTGSVGSNSFINLYREVTCEVCSGSGFKTCRHCKGTGVSPD